MCLLGTSWTCDSLARCLTNRESMHMCTSKGSKGTLCTLHVCIIAMSDMSWEHHGVYGYLGSSLRTPNTYAYGPQATPLLKHTNTKLVDKSLNTKWEPTCEHLGLEVYKDLWAQRVWALALSRPDDYWLSPYKWEDFHYNKKHFLQCLKILHIFICCVFQALFRGALRKGREFMQCSENTATLLKCCPNKTLCSALKTLHKVL